MNFSQLAYKRHNKGATVAQIATNQWLLYFIIGFVIFYTLIPCLLYSGILPDSAQNIAWGRSWEWSYNRHPPLGTWYVHLLLILLPNIELATYFASASCLAVSLYFIYQLAREYLGDEPALMATVLTSFSIFYLIYYALEFNQNTIMLPCWILVAYFFDRSLKTNALRDWLILGICSAAALLAKYESVIIILVCFLYLCAHFKKEYLKHLIAALTLCLGLLAPHFISMMQHGYLPWVFLHERVAEGTVHGFIYIHFYQTIRAFLEQCMHSLLALLVFFYIKKKYYSSGTRQFNFLVYIGFAPLICVLLMPLFMGVNFRTEWGFPLFSFTVPALFAYFQLQRREHILPQLLLLALFVHLGSLMAHKAYHYFSTRAARSNFPSYQLAEIATTYWQQFSDAPIRYVGGEENLDYYLSTYLPGKPQLYEDYSYLKSHWLSAQDIRQHGMLMILEGCDAEKSIKVQKAYQGLAWQCFAVPLNNKYKPQNKLVSLIMVPPR